MTLGELPSPHTAVAGTVAAKNHGCCRIPDVGVGTAVKLLEGFWPGEPVFRLAGHQAREQEQRDQVRDGH